MLQWAIAHADPARMSAMAAEARRWTSEQLEAKRADLHQLLETVRPPSDFQVMEVIRPTQPQLVLSPQDLKFHCTVNLCEPALKKWYCRRIVSLLQDGSLSMLLTVNFDSGGSVGSLSTQKRTVSTRFGEAVSSSAIVGLHPFPLRFFPQSGCLADCQQVSSSRC